MTAVRIPVAKPLLPSADALLPYLREIDGARTYANRGPLVRRLERRLAEHAAARGDAVAVLSSGTAALHAALAAVAVPGAFCIVPAWTFVATAHAVLLAGMRPWLLDVDPADGVLVPAAVIAALAAAPGSVRAVVPVAPFGTPFDPDPWIAFRARTGVAVVADAAASFDTVRASALPVVVSLHATKVLGAGEGGAVVSTDASTIDAVRRFANFGFRGSREAAVPAANAKLSEYGAAVALAALDAWPGTRSAYARVAMRYRHAFDGQDGVALPAGYGERWIAATTVVRLAPERLDAVASALAARGIDTRRWWGGGLAVQPAFRDAPRAALPATTAFAASTLGLPCWPDLPDGAIAEIAEAVLEVIRPASRRR